MNKPWADDYFRIVLLSCTLVVVGCGTASKLMPTPNIYVWGIFDPFENVPAELQTNYVDVLYMTDRARVGEPGPTGTTYGFKRSRSVGFGVSRVQIGDENVSWEELVKASRTDKRGTSLPLTVPTTTELLRFPQTPRTLIAEAPSHAATRRASLMGEEMDEAELTAEAGFNRELSARLALTPVKEAYVFIHGYNNNFSDSVKTIAQLWHFFGRQGVPVAYTWPAGSKGLLRGYTYDSASSEFTVFHLKQMLHLLSSHPDVEKVNIIAHSRGTDTAITALKELHLEVTASGRSTREVLKLGTVVLAAPDVDIDVVIQKFATVRLGQVPERFVMYICAKDKALTFSSWLFGGLQRLGGLKADMFTPAELEILRTSKTMQIVDARVSNTGAFGHDYFHSNPAVSSDLILTMRYKLPPGAENGRPLRITRNGFWAIDDSYPKPAREQSAGN